MESFSANIKQELSEINNLKNKELVKAELLGYLFTNLSNKFVTESEYNINRFAKLLNNIGITEYSIGIQGKKYGISIKNKSLLKEMLIKYQKENDIEKNIEEIDEIEAKAIVRGSFLGSGSVTNPSNVYHLEIVFIEEKFANFEKKLLEKYEIDMKTIKREKYTVLYIKGGEEISRFLAFIGANKSVLEFEDTRVIKDIRNKVNRLVNCETANMNKTIKTSVQQIEDIKFIKEKHKFDKLSPKEQELAEIRILNPDATLAELGKLLNPEISKSGVNHRLVQIQNLAKEIREK